MRPLTAETFQLLPLGPYQQGLWFSYRAFPGGPLDLCGLAWWVEAPPDPGRLRAALRQLMFRHPALRSTFHSAPEGPVQRIYEQVPVPFEEHDLRGHPLPEAMRALEGIRLRPYALEEEPAWRCCLLRLGPEGPGPARETAVIWLGIHHLAADGASLALLVQELDVILQGRLLPEIDRTEALAALRGARAPLSEGRRRRLQEHWSRRLAAPLPPLDLGLPRPATASHAGQALHTFPLPTALVARAEAAAREAGVRPYAVFLAAFGLLLGRLGGRERLRVAAPVSVRRPREAGLVDNLVNRVVMELELRDDEPVAELLGRVDREATQAQLHSSLPFPEVVAAARARQGEGAPPLAQAGFVWETWNRVQGDRVRLVDGVEHWSIGERPWRRLPVPHWQDELPLTLNLTRCGEAMSGRLLHDPDRLGGGDVARLGGTYVELLEALLADLTAPVGALGLIGEAAKPAHLERCAGPRLAVDDTTLVAQIVAQAARRPEAPALRCAGEVQRYGELVDRARRIAAALAARGVGRGDRVGVCLPRRPDLVAALLGVMLLGAAYVPIDPAYPEERVRFILDDSAAALLVTTRALHEAVAGGRAALLVDDPAIAAAAPGDVVGPGPDDIAYVIYTSGSTGRPKGVCIPHRCAAVLGAWAAATFPAEVWAGVFASTSICFDLSVFELWVTLSLGGAVILGENALALRDLPERAEVRLLNTVPSAMTALLDAGCVPAGVAVVNLAGEPLRRALVDRVYGLGHVTAVWNLYGPSEDTTYSTAALVPRFSSAEPTIGRPVANTRAYVLDAHQRLLPVGVAGELWLSGDKVAAGYLGRPVLTAERFLADPFAPGATMYRSGDRARWGDDGALEFLGRLDHQIKLRGHRIELGEIEARLCGLPGVRAAAAGVLELAGESRLCAWVEGDALAADELREALRVRLPAIMVPERLVVMEALPLTPNGKIDRQALPAPTEPRTAAPRPRAATEDRANSRVTSHVDARLDLRATIARVFCEVLGVDAIDPDTSFFAAGGSSLLLLRVADRLEAALGRPVPVVTIFEHPTVDRLARALSATGEGPSAARSESSEPRQHLRDIAVIGMAGRFPGAADVDALWAMSCAGELGLRTLDDADLAAAGVPEAVRRREGYIPVRGVLADVDGFDAEYFGYSPMEAEEMDPQHRLLLECAVHALEDAGCDPARFAGRIGVFVGASPSAPPGKVAPTPGDGVEWYRWTLAWSRDVLATRIAFKLGLRGPAVSVQTACSTSLVAVHQAIQSLRSGECDLAIAGGVSVIQPAGGGYLYQEGGTLAPDGRCRPFDAEAAGIVGGNGVALVILRAADRAASAGDRIHAVIRGSAVNNDGDDKMGFLAPSIPGQVEVIRRALADAGVDAGELGYVETHGTGTRLGDPIEVAALTRAFREDTAQVGRCALGSVKANIGHLDAAAGVTGLIRAILAVREGVIPPLTGFRQENPALGLGESPFFVPTAARPWEGPGPRRAGVSSFGLGGTNAHAIVEAPPAANEPPSPRPEPRLLTVSARTPAALEAACVRLAGWLEARPKVELADVAWTLQTGRTHHPFRRAIVAADPRAAVDALRTRADAVPALRRPGVAFLFPGVGTQFPGMGRALYRDEESYATVIDRCHRWLGEHADIDLKSLLFPAGGDGDRVAERLLSPRLHMPAIFATEVALAVTLEAYGVAPTAVIGHSLGEYAAAVSAGVLTVEGALALVELRGRLCEVHARGAMLAIRASEAAVQQRVEGRRGVSLAVVNGPEQCVVSGSEPEIAALARELERDGVACRTLPVSAALHSPLVEPAMDPLAALAREQTRSSPSIRFISNVAGGEVDDALVCAPEYWATHLRAPVRFSDGVMALLEGDQPMLLVEVGPGRTLSALTRQHPAWSGSRCRVVTTRLEPEDTMKGLLGALWEAGGPVEWAAQGPSLRRRVSLPGYPFERRRAPSVHRGEALLGPREPSTPIGRSGPAKGADLTATERGLAELWSEALGHASIGRDDDFFALGGHSLVALEIIAAIRKRYRATIGLDDFLVRPTIASLAARLDTAIGDGDPEHAASPRTERLQEATIRSTGGAPRTYADSALSFEGMPPRLPDPERWLIKTIWEPLHGEYPLTGTHGWVVVDDSSPLSTRLSARLSAEGRLLGRVCTLDRASIEGVVRGLQAGSVGILDFSGYQSGVSSPLQAVRTSIERGFCGIAALIAAMQESRGGEPVRLLSVTTGVFGGQGSMCRPENAIRLGPTLVAPVEQEGLTATLIDVDENAADDELLSTALYALLDRDIQDSVLRLTRDGTRLRRRHREIGAIPLTDAALNDLRAGEVYVITGGFTGIGALFAEFITVTTPARIALLGRRGVATPGADALIRRLEDKGAEVLALEVDIANASAVQAAVDKIRVRWGAPVAGVFHAAGVGGSGLLRDLQEADRCKAIGPKVLGALHLDEALADDGAAWWIFCSSLAGHAFAMHLHSDYAAANAMEDALARRWRQIGRRATSIAWDGWSTGMSRDREPTSPLMEILVESRICADEAPLAFSLALRALAGGYATAVVCTRGAAFLDEPRLLPNRLRRALLGARATVKPQRVATRPWASVERELAEVWKRVLGHTSIGIEDDFFALGGHSLVAIEIIAGVRQRFGIEMGLDDFLKRPTIAGLAAWLAARSSGRDRPDSAERLVCLQKGRHGVAPLFLIHPAGGLVFCYAELARALGPERPVYAIKSLPVDLDEAEPLTVPRLAARYLASIMSVEPVGPYLLGGASLGGMIAFEIAQILVSRGQSPSTVIMWDSPSPAGMGTTTTHLRSEKDINEYFRDLSPALFKAFESEEELPEQLRPEGFHRLFLRHVKDGGTYRPSPYEGPMVYFRAETRDSVNPPRPETQWLEVARGGVHFSVVPGNHISMLVDPHVRVSAGHLNELLPR